MKRYFLLFLVFIYISLLFWLSFMQADALKEIYNETGIVNDNMLHVISFFILAFLLHMGTICFKVKWKLIWAFIGTIAFAGIGEGVQHFLSYRHATWFDLGLHSLGAGIYLILVSIVIGVMYLIKREKTEPILIE